MTMADYDQAILEELSDRDEARMAALDHIMVQNLRVTRAYNKKVEYNSFDEGE